jgi:hypothetical protein
VALDASLLDQVLRTLGAVLEQRGRRFEIVTVGGSSLLLLGLGHRATRDLDVVALVEEGRYVRATPLPVDLAEAVRDVGDTFGLPADWLNPGPTDLLDFGLPAGFELRVQTRHYQGLVVHIASRFDQVCLKLYAAVDQGPRSKHTDDLRRLNPSRPELLAAARWARTHDPSGTFRQELRAALHSFGIEDVADEP